MRLLPQVECYHEAGVLSGHREGPLSSRGLSPWSSRGENEVSDEAILAPFVMNLNHDRGRNDNRIGLRLPRPLHAFQSVEGARNDCRSVIASMALLWSSRGANEVSDEAIS